MDGIRGGDLQKACDMLRNVSAKSKYLFFELGFNKGKSCLKTEKLNHYAALVRLLQENTQYKHYKLVGKTTIWKSYKRFLVLCSNDDRFEDGFFRKMLRLVRI